MRFSVRDFSLERTMECGQAFNYSRDSEGRYLIQHGGALISAKQGGGFLEAQTHPRRNDRVLVADYLQFGADYRNALERFSEDGIVTFAATQARGVRILRQDPYECLVSYILSQNSNISRVKTGISRLSQSFGEQFEVEGRKFHSFPDAATLSKAPLESLRRLGLGYRAEYLKAACRRIADGFDLDGLKALEYGEAKAELVKLEGVGEKVADCVLLYSLDCLDAFPVDTWIRKIMKTHYLNGRKTSDKKIAEYGRKRFGSGAGIVEMHFYAARKQLT